MKIQEIVEKTDGKILCCTDLDHRITYGFSSDLMSDILTLDPDNGIMITGLANIQALRTAEMADIHHILFVRNKEISEDLINHARDIGICLLWTRYTMFKTCGLLYNSGLKSAY